MMQIRQWAHSNLSDLIKRLLLIPESTVTKLYIIDLTIPEGSQNENSAELNQLIKLQFRPTISQLKFVEKMKYVPLGSLKTSRLNALFAYLSYLEAQLVLSKSEEGTTSEVNEQLLKQQEIVIAIHGLFEELSILYSLIIENISNDSTNSKHLLNLLDDYKLSKIILILTKLKSILQIQNSQTITIILNDSDEVIVRLGTIYMSSKNEEDGTNEELLDDLKDFKRENLISLKEVLNKFQSNIVSG